MRRSLHRFLVGMGLVGLVIGATTPAASAADKAAAAKTCQKGGFTGVVRADGTGFRNVGACVSYAAKGGVLRSTSVANLKVEFFRNSNNTCWTNFSFTGPPRTDFTLSTRRVDSLTDHTDSMDVRTTPQGSYEQTRLLDTNSFVAYTVDGVTTGLLPVTCR